MVQLREVSFVTGPPISDTESTHTGLVLEAREITRSFGGIRALKGVSIDTGRLAWVTPPGQDGNQSTVQVLAWANDDFGQVETVPGAQLTIVH